MATAGLAAIAIPALAPAMASANPVRYETATLTTTMPQQGWTHTYNITIDPSTGTFSGTGSSYQPTEGGSTNETINGTLNTSDATVSFTATYQQGGIFAGYQWGVKNASLDGTTQTNLWDLWGNQNPTTSTLTNVNTENHGQYVSSVGGGSAAGQSLIGMPTNSNK